MSKSGNRAQKLGDKAAKRRAIAAEKKRIEQVENSLPARIARAAEGPIDQCVRLNTLFEFGMGHLVVARRLPNSLLGCAFFLVDTHEAGVKDTHYQELSPADFEERLDGLAVEGDFVAMDPACARKLMRDVAAAAAEINIRPHKHFAVLERIFGDIDPKDCVEDAGYGEDSGALLRPEPRLAAPYDDLASDDEDVEDGSNVTTIPS